MRLIQKRVLKRFKEIAEKHNVEIEDIVSIESTIWKMVADKMSEGKYEDFDSFHNIYLAGLGTFHISKGKWKYTNIKRKKKENE